MLSVFLIALCEYGICALLLAADGAESSADTAANVLGNSLSH